MVDVDEEQAQAMVAAAADADSRASPLQPRSIPALSDRDGKADAVQQVNILECLLHCNLL